MNAKAILRVGMNIVRRNDTKLIAIGAGILGIITTTIAVKSGMKANEALNEAEEKLPEGEELSKKEKTTIVAKAVAPAVVSTVFEVGAIYMLFRRGKVKTAGAMALATFYQNKLIERPLSLPIMTEAEPDTQNKDSPITIAQHVDTTAIPFDIYEPISGQTIHNCNTGKLSLAEYWLNKNIEFGYKMHLDDVIQLLGGHPLHPSKANRWSWTNSVDITEYTARMYWVDFLVSTDDSGQWILRFSRLPKKDGEYTLLDTTIS